MGDELAAMSAVQRAFDDLEPEERARVLRWVVDKYRGAREGGGVQGLMDGGGDDSNSPGEKTGRTGGWASFAELVDRAQPASPADYALVGAYWFQTVQGSSDVTGQQVNTELKHLGHGTKNITDAFDKLMGQTPKLAMQVRKSGTARQARKKYKLTREGEKRVEAMLVGKAE